MEIITHYLNSADDLDNAFTKLGEETAQSLQNAGIVAQLARVNFSAQGDIYPNESAKINITVTAVAHNGSALQTRKVCLIAKGN